MLYIPPMVILGDRRSKKNKFRNLQFSPPAPHPRKRPGQLSSEPLANEILSSVPSAPVNSDQMFSSAPQNTPHRRAGGWVWGWAHAPPKRSPGEGRALLACPTAQGVCARWSLARSPSGEMRARPRSLVARRGCAGDSRRHPSAILQRAIPPHAWPRVGGGGGNRALRDREHRRVRCGAGGPCPLATPAPPTPTPTPTHAFMVQPPLGNSTPYPFGEGGGGGGMNSGEFSQSLGFLFGGAGWGAATCGARVALWLLGHLHAGAHTRPSASAQQVHRASHRVHPRRWWARPPLRLCTRQA